MLGDEKTKQNKKNEAKKNSMDKKEKVIIIVFEQIWEGRGMIEEKS